MKIDFPVGYYALIVIHSVIATISYPTRQDDGNLAQLKSDKNLDKFCFVVLCW